jgi:hypothetical protein
VVHFMNENCRADDSKEHNPKNGVCDGSVQH